MKWFKYKIHTTEMAEEIVISKLYELGITGVEIEDKAPLSLEETGHMFGDVIPEMPEDDFLADISFYVEDDKDQSAVLEEVKNGLEELRNFADIGDGSIETSETEDKDWINNWKKYFKAFKIDDISIVPTWLDLNEAETMNATKDSSMVLRIDPGTAFGTGKHDTTQLAIRNIRKYMVKGDTILDVGTGSGILGIVAAKEGSGLVCGTDIDPMAFPALEKNLENNGMAEDQFKALCVNVIADQDARDAVKAVKPEYDLVVANIIAEILAELTPFVPEFLKKDGYYITSGILNEKEDIVREAMEKAGLTVVDITRQGGWSSMVARK